MQIGSCEFGFVEVEMVSEELSVVGSTDTEGAVGGEVLACFLEGLFQLFYKVSALTQDGAGLDAAHGFVFEVLVEFYEFVEFRFSV